MKRGTKKQVFKGNVLADGAVGSLSHAVSLSTHFDYLFNPTEGGGDTGNSKKAVRELATAKLKQCQALGAPGVEGSVLETILGLLNPKGDTYFWKDAIKISTKKGKKPLYLDEKVMKLLFPSDDSPSPLKDSDAPEDALVYFNAWWADKDSTESFLDEKEVTTKHTVQVEMTGQQLLDAWWKQVMMLACGGPETSSDPHLPWQTKTFNEAPGKNEREDKTNNWNVPTCPWAATSMVPLPFKPSKEVSVMPEEKGEEKPRRR
jgi:hypothetical protein